VFDQVVQPPLSLQLGPVVGHRAHVAGAFQDTTANVNNIEGAAQKQGMAVERVTNRLDALTLRLESLERAPPNNHFDPWASAAARKFGTNAAFESFQPQRGAESAAPSPREFPPVHANLRAALGSPRLSARNDLGYFAPRKLFLKRWAQFCDDGAPGFAGIPGAEAEQVTKSLLSAMPSDLAQLIVSTRAPRYRDNQVPLLLREGVDRDTVWTVRDWIKGRAGQTGAKIRGRDSIVTVE
jgi:hypothetical protein